MLHCIQAKGTCSDTSIVFFDGDRRSYHVRLGSRGARVVMGYYEWPWGAVITRNVL